MTRPRYIGKESKLDEDVDAGLVHDWDEVQEVIDPPGDFIRELRARMRDLTAAQLAARTRLSGRQIKRIRNGRSASATAITLIERALSQT